MLEIKLSLEKRELLPYLSKKGLVYSGAFYLYQAVNRGRVEAAGLFEVRSTAVWALHYEAVDEQDAFLLDGILRAGLNYASGQGIQEGVLPDELRVRYEGLFAQLNYPPAQTFNIVNFFEKYKNCRSL